MFVSSYSTYIDTTSTSKVNSERREIEKKSSDSFNSKLLLATPKSLSQSQQLPVSYISNYKTLYNKERLTHENMAQSSAKMTFTKVNAQTTAQLAYASNSTMFSLVPKPKVTLTQTPSIDKKLPENAQKAQESFLKLAMLHTYISNENYYHITAA